MKRSEIKIFLAWAASLLTLFGIVVVIQFGVMIRSFEPRFLVLPAIVASVISSLFGYTAVLRQRLRESDRAKSEFLSRMSHEFRTPLNAILGFAQIQNMEAREGGDKGQQESSSEILMAGQHLLGLVNELLDLSRIEAGKLEVRVEAVDVFEIVEECLLYLDEQIRQKKLELAWQPASVASQGLIEADSTRLKQVLLNLLSNAVKYNRDGGSIRIDIVEDDDAWVRIQITDTGLGIPVDEQENIFTPFSRGSRQNSSIDGVGIGLGITRKLTELMGGSMGFSSEEDKGSQFWVRLKKSRANS